MLMARPASWSKPGFAAACRFGAVVWVLLVACLHADPTSGNAESGEAAPKGLFERDAPLPDPAGIRAALAARGIVLGVSYTGEVFGNPVGGYRQGAVYDGLVTLGLDVDFTKLAGWNGLKLHALAYDPHGTSGTDKYVHDLNRFSNIDAFDSIHLFELWLETSHFGNVVNVRVGQVAVDAEFATTQGGALFIHSNFGTPSTLAQNIPAPIYPQAAPGARLRLNTPDARFYFQGGVYAGNPNADRNGDPNPDFRPGTAYNDQGIRFPISGNQGLLSVYEVGFLLNQGASDHGLPGAYRIGGFFDTDRFADKRFDNQDRSLAEPRSTDYPRAHDGDEGIYAVAEQVVYRGPAGPGHQHEDVGQTASAPVANAEDSPLTGGEAPSGPELRVFGRAGFAPEDRNLVDFYAETGLNYRGLLPGRGQDVAGVGFTYTSLSNDLRQEARDANRFQGTHQPLLDYEAILEITYEANLAPWLQVQPDLQYIIHPGGSPRNDDALILGLRTVITF
jgi:porin